MDKQEHINYWIESADKDAEILKLLLDGNQFVYALFFAHLILEKLSKALWVKMHESNIPPKTHNILKLLDESEISIDENLRDFLVKLNVYQIEGRYSDDIRSLYKNTTKEMTLGYLENIKLIQQWLIELLQ